MKKIKLCASSVVALAFLWVQLNPAAAEDWKGKPDRSEFNFGVLTGLGVIDSSGGFALLGTAAQKIIQQGLIPDLNDSVWIELGMGPIFVSGTSAFTYAAHLRWNFEKDPEWTFFALGGVAGNITGASLGSRFLLFPRVGVGALWKMMDLFSWRAELSHELIAVGVVFPF